MANSNSRSPSRQTTSGPISVHKGETVYHRNGVPCPICGGTDSDPRGQGVRCTGFHNDEWCECDREGEGTACKFSPNSRTWKHKLKGECKCGKTHGYEYVAPKPTTSKGKAGRPKSSLGPVEKAYFYTDVDFNVVMRVTRHKPKNFRQSRPDGKGGWIWNLEGVTVVPYNLPAIVKSAIDDRWVIVCEGEKDADKLNSLDLIATTLPMGSKKPAFLPALREPLKGRKVVVIADNDDPGRAHGNLVCETLGGEAEKIILIQAADLPMPEGKTMPDGGDVSDYFEAGGTLETLVAFMKAAPQWVPTPQEQRLKVHQPQQTDDEAEAEAHRVGLLRHNTKKGSAGLPEVDISTVEENTVCNAIEILADDPAIYQRARHLVRLEMTPAAKKGFFRPTNSACIGVIPSEVLRTYLTRNAKFMKRAPKGSDEEDKIVHPPQWLVSAIAKRGDYPSRMRPLEAIVDAPTLRIDGSILDQPGYDEDSHLLYQPNGTFPPVPIDPTHDDAKRAAERLLFLISDFPFAEAEEKDDTTPDHHRAAWLAGALTPVARFAIQGPVPMFLFDGNCPGVGKTKLADLISVIATGRDMPRTTLPDNDEELRKRISSIAIAGDRFMLIDNLNKPLGGEALDSVLTATSWKDRLLGKLEMSPEYPWFTCLYGTGNNTRFKGDIIRRIIRTYIQTDQEKPEERKDFKIQGDLIEHARGQRESLLVDALTILRAHAVAGYPQAPLPSFGSYDAWSRVVRQAVYWVTGFDPCGVRKAMNASDEATGEREALLDAWAVLPKGTEGVSSAEALRMADDQTNEFGRRFPTAYPELQEAFMKWSRGQGLPGAMIVGHKLKAMENRVTGGKVLRSRTLRGTKHFYVQFVKPKSGGDGGDGGVLNPKPQIEEPERFSQWSDSDLGCKGEDPTKPTIPTTDEREVGEL